MSVYSWGRNSHGELGLSGDAQSSEWAPQAIAMEQAVSCIAAGDGHTLFSTESGDVFACGRGRQGQLGQPMRENLLTPTLVSELSHESVVRVAASGVSSFAITATGRVYHWGLVHRPDNRKSEGHEESKSGERAGRAVSRATSSAASSSLSSSSLLEYDQVAAGQLTGLAEDQEQVMVPVDKEARAHLQSQAEPQYASRQLKDIVTDSTERWMLANDDADAEYYRELQSMGYDKEELDERMQNRDKEYHGMLRIQCKRGILPLPELIYSLSHVKIVALAAGFAHCIALSEQGMMYSCGYNDRGQLGLGHRISSSEFKVVDYMQGKVVLQVECGQQHSMCRAVDRVHDRVSLESSLDSRVGAAVFVWGNGMLGQLGLGLKGTSKGRLLPTLLTTLSDVAPLGAVDISAGGNFSVAVALDGSVFSWGHAEYNQHGSTMVGGNDYVDNHFYFVPRPIEIARRDGSQERISQVSCGSNYTVAVTDEGDVYSWGWNAYGVLGHGRGYFGQSALKVAALGQAQIDRSVCRLAAGSNHVLAITSSSGNSWAKTFQQLLHAPSAGNARPHAPPLTPYDPDTFSDAEILDETSGTVFPCHRVLLAARSPYFAGFLRAAGGGSATGIKERIVLDTPAASASTIQYLLQYLYTDTLSAPAHKRRQLAQLADFVAMHRLAGLCRHHGVYADRPLDASEPVPPSLFESDLLAMVQKDVFTDCRFIVHSLPRDCSCDEMEGTGNAISELHKEPLIVSGHKVLFSKMPYFRSLFSGDFSDGHVGDDGVMVYDLAGFLHDGIDMSTFERLVRYVYSGSSAVLDVPDSRDLMGLLIAANRVGLVPLTQLCEKTLSLHLNDFPANIENCLAFSQMYNIPRLSRQCEELMALSAVGGGDM